MVTDSRCFNRTPQGRRRMLAAPRLGMIILLGLMTLPAGARAVPFTVNSTDDGNDVNPGDGICATAVGGTTCTLRAAIQESNALAGPDTIDLPANTYTLTIATIAGGDEDDAATGDLDISDDLSLDGSTTGPTIISANGVDRVFDVIGPAVVSMTHLTIQDGIARGDGGGGIRTNGGLTLTQVTMRNNSALNRVGDGGGDGGAVANFAAGELTLTNVTMIGNTAEANGGAIVNLPDGTVRLTNVTITGNSAASGGGIRNESVVHMLNSIVSANSAGGNCSGSAIDSLGFNLEDANTCLLDAAGDLPNTNPAFAGPPADNGGYALTVALSPGSPAIDAGDNTNCPPIDQRGFPRPVDGNADTLATCDIGAFEVQPNVTPSPTPTLPPLPTSTATVPTTPLPTGTGLPTPTASATATPRGPTIIAGMATGFQGDRVSFSVTLDTMGADIGSAQSDISFDVANAPIAALPDGTPDCAINAGLGKGSSFSFVHFAGCQDDVTCACAETACTAVRAAVFTASVPVTPLPNGAVLYSCHVNIAASAVPGNYPLSQSRIVMGDLTGQPVPGTGGIDGAIVVLEAPTPTPTPTPLPCVGDCDRSGEVTMDDLITMVNSALGAPLSSCAVSDADHSGDITIDEILLAVNNAVGGCGAEPPTAVIAR